MSHRQRLDLEEARKIRKAGFDTVGRYLFNEDLDCHENSIGPEVLEAAADIMRGTDAEYAPVVVDLVKYEGETSCREAETTLAFVNTEENDDVIVLCPRLSVGGDGR